MPGPRRWLRADVRGAGGYVGGGEGGLGARRLLLTGAGRSRDGEAQVPNSDDIDAVIHVLLGESLHTGIVRIYFCDTLLELLYGLKFAVLILVTRPSFPKRSRSVCRKVTDDSLKKGPRIIIVIDRYQESQVSVDKFDFAAKELQAFFIDPQGHVRLMGTVIFHES